MGNEISHLTILGLTWDIAGVLMLAVGLLGVTEREMDWAQTWNGSGYLAQVRLIEKTDALYGIFALVVGFGFQIGGAFKISTPIWGIGFGVALLLGVIIAHQIMRRQNYGRLENMPPPEFRGLDPEGRVINSGSKDGN